MIRLAPYHRRCDSTQRRIIADVIPPWPPAPRRVSGDQIEVTGNTRGASWRRHLVMWKRCAFSVMQKMRIKLCSTKSAYQPTMPPIKVDICLQLFFAAVLLFCGYFVGMFACGAAVVPICFWSKIYARALRQLCTFDVGVMCNWVHGVSWITSRSGAGALGALGSAIQTKGPPPLPIATEAAPRGERLRRPRCFLRARFA